MHPGYASKKIALIVGCGIAAVGLILYFGTLLANDTLCIARKNVQPKEQFFNDPDLFVTEIQALREEVLAALIRQFDINSGFFIYEEHPVSGRTNRDNDIRQLLASRVLALESKSDDELRGFHAQNLNAILENWYREEGDRGYVYWDEKSKLGGNAMLLRTLVVSPFFDAYRSEAAALARGIESLQHEDGSFSAWYKAPAYAYDEEYLLTFYSGEAILALLEYAQVSGDTEAYRAALRAQEYYLKRYVEEIDVYYYPAYVPWHTQSLAHLFEKTGERKYAEAIFLLNDKLLELQDETEFVGRFYNSKMPHFGFPHAASDAVYVEGLAHAHKVAAAVGDSVHESLYYNALVLGVHNLRRLQYTPGFLSIFADASASEKLKGAIMTTQCHKSIRIDTQAHAVDALTALLVSEGD